MKVIVKRFILVVAAVFAVLPLEAQQQKFAFVDTEYILNNIPEYKTTQAQLDRLSADWQKEIEAKYAEVENMYKKYQAEKIVLTDEMKKKREDDIINKEQAVKELQKKYYGPEGELTKKQQELVKPIQDDVYKAIKEMAIEGGFAAVFDTSADASILYTDPRQDKSDKVLEIMGYKK